MKKRRIFVLASICTTLLALAVGLSRAQEPVAGTVAAPQAPLGTAFTYQGRLTDGSSPADGQYDLRFALYDATSGGTPIDTVTVGDVQVSDGLFTVQLDFGDAPFAGSARYLEIGVRPGDSSGSYTTLTPRQPLTPAPYALALPGLRTQQNTTSPNVIGGYSGNAVSSGVYGATIGGGGSSGHENAISADYGAIGGGWSNQVSSSAATIGGGQSNLVTATCATIGGGYFNESTGNMATVAGGQGNDAIGYAATVAGGQANEASGDHAAVGGGENNDATASWSTVGGGWVNDATASWSTVGGGRANDASGLYSTIPGGQNNIALGDYSFAAGRRAKANHGGTFVWADSTDTDFTSALADTFIVRAGGGVGLGTNAPQNQLHVQEAINATAAPGTHVVQIENTATGVNPDVLALKVGTTGNPGAGSNFITFYKGDDVAIGAIDGDGAGGITYKSGGGDYAEFLPRLDLQERIEPGDLVGVFDGQVSRATRGADRVMVVSTRPIVLGNDPGEGNEARYEKVAFVGQVEVKVRGPVQAGDLIVPSGLEDGSGAAVAPEVITAAQFTQVVGQAWESSADPGLKQVRAVVGLPQADTNVAQRLQFLEAENAALRGQVDALQQQNADFEGRLAALEQGGASSVAHLPSPWWLVGALVVVGFVTLRWHPPRSKNGP